MLLMLIINIHFKKKITLLDPINSYSLNITFHFHFLPERASRTALDNLLMLRKYKIMNVQNKKSIYLYIF